MRWIVGALAALVGLWTGLLLGASPAAAVDTDAGDTVQAMLDANSTGGTNGYYLREIDGPVHAASNSGVQFEPASAIKAVIFAHAMSQVDAGAVTLATQIPSVWVLPGPANNASCPQNTGNTSISLSNALTLMMVNSDNGWTQALRDFFGDAAILQTAATLGMSNSVLQHLIGCISTATAPAGFVGSTDTPNALTLVDAGLLWEQMATGFLDDWDNARTFLTSSNNQINTVIDNEAGPTGLSAQGINDFKAAQRSVEKAGNYDRTINGQSISLRATAGWADVPFKDAFCSDDTRGYVHGLFIDQSTTTTTGLNLRAATAELYRERLRAGLQSWANCEEDLELIDLTFVNPPATIDVNTPTDLTVRHEFVNNGPGEIADAVVEVDVTVPADCTAEPASYTIQRAAHEGIALTEDRTVSVTCAQPSNHEIEVDATISSALSGHIDPDPSNNDAGVSIEPAVIAYADLAVTGLDTSELDGAVVGDLLVGGEFGFDVPVELTNHGDTELGVYPDPSGAVLTRTIVVPEGVSASVVVTGAEDPATVVVQADGQAAVYHQNEHVGAVRELSGPGTIRVISFQDLAVDTPVEVATEFRLSCEAPGTYDVTLSAAVEPEDPHVLDPTGGNDELAHTSTVECAVPVAINIRPGNAKNQIKINSAQTVPVAVLTTEAGEYGLPGSFDATTIDAATVRFGTAETLGNGDGSVPKPLKLLTHDSFEPDDSTKDGDVDAVVNVSVPGAGITTSTTEACVTGSYSPDGVHTYSFYGCDVVAPK